ncbi:MAG: efflux RND transporter permease subunit, partial [Planctomycetes bacterium]|nr:efflux RND transporter permease subunit [Planctomycetota bacterium]
MPEDSEDPEIVEVRPYIPVIAVVVHGNVSEHRLRETAREVRDDLRDMDEISEVVLSGIREREIWVEVRPELLEEYGLTFEDVGRAVGRTNLDVPGGQLRGALGNIRVRTLGETERATTLENLVVRSDTDGAVVRLRDVASVRDTFEDKIEFGRFSGAPASTVTVFKAPEEDALKIANAVKKYVARRPERLGGAIDLSITTDLARFIAQRLDLMIRNARAGIFLVVLALAFFLDLRVAFWVAMGLPISFLGAFVVMDWMGVTINLISLFGLIVVLGLVVDDAIVVGENIFTKIRSGMPLDQAAIHGSNQVAVPVVAAVLTTVVAFLPLAYIEGELGNFLEVLPKVIIAALAVSLMEVFLILPAHLAHRRKRRQAKSWHGLRAFSQRQSDAKNRFLEVTLPDKFERLLRLSLRWRYVTVAVLVGFFLAVMGFVASGIVPFVLIQNEDAENVLVNLEMSTGTPVERTAEVIDQIDEIAREIPEVKSVYTVVGTSFSDRGRETAADPATVGQLNLELLSAEERETKGMRSSEYVITELRRKTRDVTGVRKLVFLAQSGGPQGADIEVRVRSDSIETLAFALAHVRREVESYDGILEVEDDLNLGKQEVRLRVRDSAFALGLTTSMVALQIRHALFGFEAQELQSEDEEIKVRVLLPEVARKDLADLWRVRVPTPAGGRVPLEEVAHVYTARGYASLARVDGKRAATLKAEVDEDSANVSEVTSALARSFADIGERFPGVSLTFEGRRKEARESLGSLAVGFPAALLMIFAIIAILFRSYLQPFIVMVEIPFSLVGAVLGHLCMGYPLT